jgi:hypothetical protein
MQFSYDVLARLRHNGELSLERRHDHVPVLRVFNPYGTASWLLTESDPVEPDHLYGLADVGNGRPLLGWISRDAMEQACVHRWGYRLPLERDRAFAPRYPLSIYALAARSHGAITLAHAALAAAHDALAARRQA